MGRSQNKTETTVKFYLKLQSAKKEVQQSRILFGSCCMFVVLLMCIPAWYEIWLVNYDMYDWDTKDAILFIFLSMCSIGLFCMLNCCQLCVLSKKQRKHLKCPAKFVCSGAFVFYFLGIFLCFVNFNVFWNMQNIDNTWQIFLDILIVCFIFHVSCVALFFFYHFPLITDNLEEQCRQNYIQTQIHLQLQLQMQQEQQQANA